jgi:hypothetical protein
MDIRMVRFARSTLLVEMRSKRAIRVLIRLVRQEYPQGRTLAEIADIWGNASEGERQALEALAADEK